MNGSEWISKSPDETSQLGRRLGSLLEAGDCIALKGELGAGKTHFAKAVAEGLGCLEPAISPTFNRLLEYPARVPLRHLDAYFADRQAGLMEEAAAEIFGSDGVALVEWADRIPAYLPDDRLEVTLEILGRETRRLRILGSGARAKRIERQLVDGAKKKGSPSS